MTDELKAAIARDIEEMYGPLAAQMGTNDKPYEVHLDQLALTALQAIQSSGTFMVVPVEPTEEMLLDAVDAWHETNAGLDEELSAAYKAILAACK